MKSRITAAVAAGVLAALAVAAPAAAHADDAPAGSDYRTEVRALEPAVPGLTVRAIEAGARLELANHTGRPIEVLGYAGEPYLEIRPDGVYENLHSPATYLNHTLHGETEPPASADPTLPPSWRRISTEPVARWHDQRTHWMESSPPAQVSTDPDRSHRLRDWTVPLRDGASTLQIRGTLDWVPPPNTALWWAIGLLGAAVVALLAFWPARAATPALGAFAAAGGLAALTFAVGRTADAGTTGLGGFLQGLLTEQIWTLLAGLGALAVGAYALLRRPVVDFALALGGTCLALFAGAANGAVFTWAVVPVPWPVLWARIAVVAAVATGAGVAAAGILRLRAATRTAPHAKISSPTPPSPVSQG